MKLNKLLVASLAVAYSLPIVAFAGSIVPGPDRHLNTIVLAQADTDRFVELDANQDGVIDREEAAVDPEVAAAFEEIDTAGTGVITPEEFSAWEEVSGTEY